MKFNPKYLSRLIKKILMILKYLKMNSKDTEKKYNKS